MAIGTPRGKPRREVAIVPLLYTSWDFLALPLDEKLDHTLAKFFGADGPAMDGDAPRPGFRHRAEADQGYDSFDDAYTRFAGRGAWGRGFDAEQL